MTADTPTTCHFETVVTDRTVEEPWAVGKVRAGERVLDVGSATSRYLTELPADCGVYAIDLRPTPARAGIGVLRGDVLRAPFARGAFDVITCISTIEHVGLDVYGQFPNEFADEVAMRYMRLLLRPGGRLLLTAPYGRRNVNAWLRVYDRWSFGRLTAGYRALSIEYCRREGETYTLCARDDVEGAAFDFRHMRSNGVVLAELTPVDGLSFAAARAWLRLRTRWRRLTHRRVRFWEDITEI